MNAPDLIAVHAAAGYAVNDEGEIIPIVTMFDEEGAGTTDLGDAVCFVAGPDSHGQWYAARFDLFGGELN